MDKLNTFLEDIVICLTGFAIGVLFTITFFDQYEDISSEPEKIDWLFEPSNDGASARENSLKAVSSREEVFK
ncbi:MAG: hypothetical protein AAGA50_14175 [Pseudomonadota bacterium]